MAAKKRRKRNAEKSEQTKHYRTQSAAEKAAERAHKKYYSVTLWRVNDRDWAVHAKELKPKDLRNPRGSVLLFRSRAAAVKYAKSHGAKKFSVRKLRRGK